jgi:hypothetical protein
MAGLAGSAVGCEAACQHVAMLACGHAVWCWSMAGCTAGTGLVLLRGLVLPGAQLRHLRTAPATQLLPLTSQAEKQAETSAIRMRQRIAEAEARLTEQEVETRLVLGRERGLADAAAYATAARAKANQQLLTPEYLQQQYMQALAASSKVYFGDSIPKMLADNWLAAGQLQRREGQAQTGEEAAAAADSASQQ